MSEERIVKRTLLVVSLLDGKGPTGVETHFQQIIEQARAGGIDARLICPFPLLLWARLASLASRALAPLNRERAAVFRTWMVARVVGRKLGRALAQGAEAGRTMVVCAQDPVSAGVARKVRQRHPCRVVTVIHYNVSIAHELQMKGETTPHGPLWRQAMRAEASALPLVDGIIFVSGFMRRVVLERLPVLATVPHTVIPNFVAGASAGAPGPSWAGDVIAIGSLEPRKNQGFLLHVLARAQALGFRYTLTLVGDGPDHARLVALADELGVAHQVNFAGFQPRAADLIAQHRVLAHAALVENLPLALIEALAAGRPVLAPAVGGIPEVFTHGSAGYHWALDNVDAAARLLIGVLSDSEEYARLARAAVARYRSAFDPAVLVPRWLAAILPPLPPPAADSAGAPPAPLRRERGRAGTARA